MQLLSQNSLLESDMCLCHEFDAAKIGTRKNSQIEYNVIWRLLHVPLWFKVVLANSAMTMLLAMAGAAIAAQHVRERPTDIHYELIACFMVVGFSISFAFNSLVMKLVLTPLDRLQAAANSTKHGPGDAPITASLISDKQLDYLIAAFTDMQNTLQQYAQQIDHFPQSIVQAQEEERQRIARELHDEAAQTLTSLLLYLRLLEKSLDPEDALRIGNLCKLATHALDEIRQLAVDLNPRILDDWGLEAALGRQVDELNAAGTLKTTLQLAGNTSERLRKDLELTFYRVAQEALNNTVRHAHARCAQVVLKREAGWLTLEVQDDGVGFNTGVSQSGRPSGFGLVGMRERLALVRGELVIESQPGKGARVCARAPLCPPPTPYGVAYENDSRLAGR
jgi:two-component system sensor histidine kinase UhpB